jgi:hypothetical protein
MPWPQMILIKPRSFRKYNMDQICFLLREKQGPNFENSLGNFIIPPLCDSQDARRFKNIL